MRRLKLFAAVCSFLFLWACSSPDQRVKHVEPLETVPSKTREVPREKPPVQESKAASPAGPSEGLAAGEGRPGPGRAEKAEGVTSTPSTAVREEKPENPLRPLIEKTVQAVLNAHPEQNVVVFPALSPSEATKAVRCSALGDRISGEIAKQIRTKLSGVEVPTFGELRTLLNSVANRGLCDILSPEDPYFLADRIGAELVVMGSIRPTIRDRDLKLIRLHMRYETRDLRNATTLKVAERIFPGSAEYTHALARELNLEGEWRVGMYAPEFHPSLKREMQFVLSRSAASLLSQAGSQLKEKRLAVAPIRTAGSSDQYVKDFLRAFNEERRSLATKASPWSGREPYERALDMGPVTILGKRFETLREARDRLRVLTRQAEASSSYSLSTRLAELFSETLRQQTGDEVEITLGLKDRRAIEDFLAREARISEQTGSIIPESISKLRTKGAQYLLLGSFFCPDFTYNLKSYIVNASTGKRVAGPVVFSFDPRLTEKIKERF